LARRTATIYNAATCAADEFTEWRQATANASVVLGERSGSRWDFDLNRAIEVKMVRRHFEQNAPKVFES
jgi:hypothetical protein